MNDGGMPPRADRTREFLFQAIPLSLMVAVVALVFFAWLSEQVLDLHTKRFDDQVRAAVHGFASAQLTWFMRGLTEFGSAGWLIPAVVVLIVLFVIRGWRREARLLGVTMAGALVLDIVLKLSYHRARPTPFFDITPPHTYAFPSGHALAALCFYGVLAGILTMHVEVKWLRWGVWALATLLVGLIGLSRIYLGVHYPSDVIGGYAAAVVWLGGVWLMATGGHKG
jgi:undecaprenyl-diphosphatase